MTESKKVKNTDQPNIGCVITRLFPLNRLGLKAHSIFWSIVICGVTLDLWSKWAIFEWLIPRHSNTFSIIDGFLQLVLVLNEGAAFGLASGMRLILVTFSVIGFLAFVTVFYCSGNNRTMLHVVLALLTAGTCGNLYDRIFNQGLVRDFIDVYYKDYHWPAFNVADSMLCVGVGMLILSNLIPHKPHQKHDQQQK